jgi:hypothetical protein
MKKYLLIIFIFLNVLKSFSQNENQDWILFKDEKNDELIGYKDLNGEVKIEPKFTFLTNANVFKNIIPVFEKVNIKNKEDYKTTEYYLLKNGKKVGVDSLYVFDFTLDCENEDKIRFRDPKTDKVGFFDKNGKVIISAIYNDASTFHNGLAIVIRDAKRICWEGEEVSKENPCEHWSWKGTTQIINSKNELILDNVDLQKFQNIDWYSLQINPKEINSDNITFKALDGNIYAFKNTEKEFETWLYNEFISKSEKTNFLNNCFENITVCKNANLKSKEFENSKFEAYAWAFDKKENVYKNNKDFIVKIIEIISLKKLKINISNGSSPVLFEYENNKSFYNNCGEYLNEKCPYFKVYIRKEDGFSKQYYLGFIRTKQGYKLIEIS